MLTLAQRLILCGPSFKQVSGFAGRLSYSGNETSTGVFFDSSGNVYIAGTGVSSRGYIAKITQAGTLAWIRRITAPGSTGFVSSFAVDSSGNSYSNATSSSGSLFNTLVKYNASGVIQWQRSLTDSGTLLGNGACTDGTNVILALQTNTTVTTAHVVKYNSSGTIQWQRKLSHTYSVEVAGVSIDASGNSYVVGRVKSDGATFIGFVAKYNSAGVIQWQKYFSNSGTAAYSSAVFASPSGSIYISGAITVSGASAGFIMKMDSGGSVLWARYVSGGTAGLLSGGICEDALGYIYFSGSVVLKLLDAGSLVWQRSLKISTNYASSSGVAVLGDDYVIAGSPSISGSGIDPFFAVLPTSGGGTGNYGPSTYAQTSLTLTAITPTIASGGLTDASGVLTDAAGAATDAAETSLTYTKYTP